MRNPLMKNAKNTIKLGMTSMVGMGAMGAIGSVPGMPAAAKNTANIAGVGLNLVNIGQLSKTGMDLTKIIKVKR